MKRDELKNLRSKPAEELKKEAKMIHDKLWQLKADLVSGKVKNAKEIHKLKNQIAVINTIINEDNKK